jgi:hypothetical protein
VSVKRGTTLNVASAFRTAVASEGWVIIDNPGLIDKVAIPEFTGSLIAFPVDFADPTAPYADGVS